MDTFATIPPTGLAALHNDPPEPVPGAGDGMLLDDLPAEAIAPWWPRRAPGRTRRWSRSRSAISAARPALRTPSTACCRAIDAPYALFAVGMAANPEMKQAVVQRLDRPAGGAGAVGRRPFLNFTERPTDTGRMFSDDAYRRLREVKSKYDPDNIIQANHEIPPS